MRHPPRAETPADWVDVYIHAKLMLIDDTYMTLGSANINTRSMEVDSELNIAHDRPEVTRPLRQQLWRTHTNGRSGSENMSTAQLKLAYQNWGKLINDNKRARHQKKAPLAALVEFYNDTPELSNLD